MAIQQLPGSNALATAERVRERMRELSEDFPKGLEYRVVYDPTVFIDESVRAVIHTIFEAALLVVVVVMAFLQSWRASVISILAIPLSLIGPFSLPSGTPVFAYKHFLLLQRLPRCHARVHAHPYVAGGAHQG